MGLDNPLHILILLLVILLVFGAKRLPEIGRSLGEGMRGFKETISGESRPHNTVSPAPPPVVVAPPAPAPAMAVVAPAEQADDDEAAPPA